MTDTTTAPAAGKDTAVSVLGIVVAVAGVIMIVAGAMTWLQVSSHLQAENIVVSEDAASNAGEQVTGPMQAYAEAEVIQKHALEATGGKTYAQLEREDPLREVAMTASFLRASLFTSVVSFGVAAMAVGLGILNIIIGFALIRLARRA